MTERLWSEILILITITLLLKIALIEEEIIMRIFIQASLAIALSFGIFPVPTLQAQTLKKPILVAKPGLDGILDNQSSNQGLSQVTNVSELRDVQPADWAYESLKSLVERYGCIVGYPDRTFRGNRALSRWEFAAGLNACLNTIERLLQENVAVLREDLNKLKALAQNFEQELAGLGARVDNLEARTAYLEDHRFSTTTKLTGATVLGLTGIASGDKNNGTEAIPQVPALGYRTRLEFNTSFTGEDLLFTRLSTGNQSDFLEETGTFQATLGFAQPQNNEVGIEQVYYRFPAAENLTVWVEGFGALDDFNNTLNVLDGDGNFGALSKFATRSPIYYGAEGGGIGLQGNWGDLQFSGGYLAPTSNSPSSGEGLFNGSYGAIAQVGYVPQDGKGGIALVYRHGYNTVDTFTGSDRANFRAFTEAEFGEAVPVSDNSYGLVFSWPLADQFVLGGWGGYTNAQVLGNLEAQVSRGGLDIWNWAVTLGFPDLFKEGNLAGIVVGMQPWVASSNVVLGNGLAAQDQNTSWHFEAFYQYVINDHIQITPGIVVVTNANNDDRNGTLVLGTIRTVFAF